MNKTLHYIGQRRPNLGEPLGVDVTYQIQWYESKVDLSELAKLRFEDGWTTVQLASHFKRSEVTIRGYYGDIKDGKNK